jgi:hypothetical protein
LYAAKRFDVFLWDGHACDVQIEAANALVFALIGMGYTEEIDAAREFGAL